MVKTDKWLKRVNLKAETEELMTDAQDQSLPIRNNHANIIKNGSNLICRLYEQNTESIDNVVSGCPIQAPIKCK